MAGGKISEALIHGLTVRESATDGSDFSNPAADYRRLFLGEDGQLHAKDSAGAVTDIGAGSGNVATDTIWDTAGDLAVGSGANTAARLAVGTEDYVLTVVSGVPAWAQRTVVGVSVYNDGTQTLTNSTDTPVTFGAEEFDTDGFHDTGSDTDRLTVPAGLGGKYHVWGATNFAAHATGARFLSIYKNADASPIRQVGWNPDSSATFHLQLSSVVVLAAGDYIKLRAYQASGGNLNIGAATNRWLMSEFGMVWLGA